jgi:hypothetical protein
LNSKPKQQKSAEIGSRAEFVLLKRFKVRVWIARHIELYSADESDSSFVLYCCIIIFIDRFEDGR